MKICTCCNIEKDINEFGMFKRSPDGRVYNCKTCRAALGKRYYEMNHDAVREKCRVRQREAYAKQKLLREQAPDYVKPKRGRKRTIFLTPPSEAI